MANDIMGLTVLIMFGYLISLMASALGMKQIASLVKLATIAMALALIFSIVAVIWDWLEGLGDRIEGIIDHIPFIH